MPLKSGYSHATFSANLAELIRNGYERNSAIMASASKARESYFKRFPNGALPNWLAFPKSARTANHYTANGTPMLHTQRNPRAESAPNPASLAKSAALYEGFTGEPPRKIRKLAIPPLPKTALAIGKIFGIMYSVDATGERFHHEFKGKAQPLLVVSPDGQQVFVHGGAYTFTKRGFVDN